MIQTNDESNDASFTVVWRRKETRRKEAILAPYPLHYVKGVVGYVWMKRLVSVYLH